MRALSQIVSLLHHNPTLEALAKCRIFTCNRSFLRFKRQIYHPHPKKKPFFASGKPFATQSLSPEP